MCGTVERKFCGDEAISNRGILTLKHPVNRGVMQDTDDMERILHYSFYNELRAAPEEHPVLLSSIPFTPKATLEQMIRMMFETFAVPATNICLDGILSYFSCPRGISLCVVLIIYNFYSPSRILVMVEHLSFVYGTSISFQMEFNEFHLVVVTLQTVLANYSKNEAFLSKRLQNATSYAKLKKRFATSLKTTTPNNCSKKKITNCLMEKRFRYLQNVFDALKDFFARRYLELSR